MKAAVCTHFGPPEELEVHDIPSPVPSKGQALISVRACGVNFPDVLVIQNKHQSKPALPFIPGAELAGVVKTLGEGVTHIKPGDRVCAFVTQGGMAEEAVVDARGCMIVPESIGFDVAASFMVTYGTSWYALKRRGELKLGDHLVVLGAAGGVGLSAVDIGKALGARVIAAASTQAKVDLAKKQGAADGFVYPAAPLSRDQQKEFSENIKRLTEGFGADVLYDPVGDDYAEPALRAMNWNGRYLVVGFAAGRIPKVPLNLPLLKHCQIVGVFFGAQAAREPSYAAECLREILELIAQGKLKPYVSERIPLGRAAEAFRMLMDRRAQGKIVVTM